MRSAIRSMVAAAFAGVAACSGHAANVTATPGTVEALINAARGGDRIVLAPGDYAPLSIKGKTWSPALTVEAAAGRMKHVEFNYVSGIVWHGGTFDGGDTITNAFGAGHSDHVTVDGLRMSHYTRNNISLGESSDARIVNNLITDSGSDGIDIALSRRVLVDHNECRDTNPTPGAHPDCIQMWSRPTAPPVADITITNNTVSGDTQGITGFNHIRDGVDDGGFDRIRVEDNKVAVKQWHGITLTNCRSCVVRRNRVDTIPNGRIQAWIKFIESDVEACGNVISAYGEKEDKRCKE
jgi:hypothetical protein